jgi:hypothetical protein
MTAPLTPLQTHVLDTILRELRRLHPASAAKVLLEAARQQRQAMDIPDPPVIATDTPTTAETGRTAETSFRPRSARIARAVAAADRRRASTGGVFGK